jgi:2-polyprenyl-6-methoxyphenol hydroxylase-like FAD-dependent oxidoreductase
METTDVLIAGAGPTGLAAAAALKRRGVRVIIVDRQAAGTNTSRAAVVHSHTLEQLEAIGGVTERLVARGIHARRFTIRDRDRILMPVRFDGLPTKYPYTLMISQAETEAALLGRLVELGGEVRRPKALASFTQDAEGVTAALEDGEAIRACYLVGADGMHSVVRSQANIAFPGDSYEQSFSLADVHLGGRLPRDEVMLYFSPAGLVVVAPLPAAVHRIVATVDDAPEHPDAAFVQALLDARGPERERAVVRDVVWGSRFRVHHRIAETYRTGRVLLAGDAAHVHSPAGGQGMNIGIQDGVMLAGALARVLGGASDALLDEYAIRRRPVALQVVGLADRLTRIATVPARLRPMRNLVLRVLACVPRVRNELAWRLSGLVYRAA